MPNQSTFPKGFTGDLVVRGLPIMNSYPGNLVWVDRNGSNNGDGSFVRPYVTLQNAIDACRAGRGDIIIVKPGHTETISTAAILILNKAGIAIIGLGAGSSRPTLTFTAAAGNIPVTAANITLKNLLFVANFADVVSAFTATGTATPTDFCIESCEFRDTSAILNFAAILTDNATANSFSGLSFIGNKISSLCTTAARSAFKMSTSASHDRVTFNDNVGNWAIVNDTACFLAGGACNFTNFEMARNKLNVPNTSSTGGSFVSSSSTACTGHCYDNYLWQIDATAGIWIPTGTKLAFTNNLSPITGGADKNALVNPAAG